MEATTATTAPAQTTDATTTTAKESTTTAAPEQEYELNIFGQKQKMPMSEIIKRAQMSEASSQKFEEASKMRKEVESFQKMLDDNPKEFMRKMKSARPEMRKVLEEVLAEDLEEELMPENEKKMRQFMRDKEAFEAEKAGVERQKHDQMMSHMQEQARVDISSKIMTSLDVCGLPKSPEVVKDFAATMQQLVEAGYRIKDINMDSVASHVRDRYQAKIRSFFGGMSGDDLIKHFGEDTANKIRKADLARLRTAATTKSQSASKPAQSTPKPFGKQEQPKQMSTTEYQDYLRKKIEGK